MKIVYIAPFGLGKKTTIWARTIPLARQLTEKGHTTAIIIPPWDTPQDAGKCWIDGGVSIINVPLTGGTPLIVLRLLRASKEFAPDLIHIVKPRAHAGLCQWMIWQLRQLHLSATPLLLDMDDWEQAWAPINHYPKITARFLAWQEEWGIRHADGVTTASRWLHEQVRRDSPSMPTLYLPNGIDDSLLTPSTPTLPRTGRSVLFFTRYVEVTPGWLADFADHLLNHDPLVQFTIAGEALQPAGDQPFRAALALRGPDLARRIEWRGAIAKDDVRSLLDHSTCAIFPSEASTLQLAKCSVRLATTLLRGVPVVASAVGEQAHYGANGAARLTPANAAPNEFAQAVLTLLDDSAAQQQMIEAAHRHLAENYPWRRLAGQLERFYEQVKIERAK